MKSIRLIGIVAILGGLFAYGERSHAAFHFMQIQQVIGGVNSDPNAQAIQLRMRAAGQSVVSLARIRAWDAAGANPILLVDMTTDVANSAAGSTILIATTGFATYTDIPLVSDFTMTPIPASYLAAGRLTFETNAGTTIYWSLAWGGAGYTGANNGAMSPAGNDADGNFGPPFAGALPSTSTSALLTNLPATGRRLCSTNNAANYAITAGAATFKNNAGTNFLVTIPPPPDPNADFDDDQDVDGEDFLTWQRNTGGTGDFEDGDANFDGDINNDDLVIWQGQYNTPPPLVAAVAAVPEPGVMTLTLCGLLALAIAGCGVSSSLIAILRTTDNGQISPRLP